MATAPLGPRQRNGSYPPKAAALERAASRPELNWSGATKMHAGDAKIDAAQRCSTLATLFPRIQILPRVFRNAMRYSPEWNEFAHRLHADFAVSCCQCFREVTPSWVSAVNGPDPSLTRRRSARALQRRSKPLAGDETRPQAFSEHPDHRSTTTARGSATNLPRAD